MNLQVIQLCSGIFQDQLITAEQKFLIGQLPFCDSLFLALSLQLLFEVPLFLKKEFQPEEKYMWFKRSHIKLLPNHFRLSTVLDRSYDKKPKLRGTKFFMTILRLEFPQSLNVF